MESLQVYSFFNQYEQSPRLHLPPLLSVVSLRIEIELIYQS